jgi:hypothetical protein
MKGFNFDKTWQLGFSKKKIITINKQLICYRYQKYLYDYECDREHLSHVSELQKAIDENRREGRRQAGINTLQLYINKCH